MSLFSLPGKPLCYAPKGDSRIPWIDAWLDNFCFLRAGDRAEEVDDAPRSERERTMDGQRQRSGFGGGRRRKPRKNEKTERPELVRIAARRPDSPLLAKVPKRTIAASAVPKRGPSPGGQAGGSAPRTEAAELKPVEAPRRTARIVQLGAGGGDERERERQKLLKRLMESDGRGAISRATDEFLRHGFSLPDEQAVHLQLLEHFDETRAQESLTAMKRLLTEESPIKKTVLDQRLRRLEEHADESITRDLAADLRRTLRT
jgi:hypothetical protein